jgi:sec-independent protein translocase protein TatA
MGFGGISIWQLLIILAIVVLVFGTKRLKTLGGDLGGALKSFRKAMDHDEEKERVAEEAKRLEAAAEPKPATEPDAEFAERKDKASHG